MSDENQTRAGGFKLSTIETARRDPMLKPIDVVLLSAYMSVMKWPARTAYLCNLTARVECNMVSEPTITASRKRLIKIGYIKLVFTKPNGAVVYEINNTRADMVADHVSASMEKLKELDAIRKEKSRTRTVATKKTLVTNDESDQRNLGDMTKEIYDNYPYKTLKHYALKEEDDFQEDLEDNDLPYECAGSLEDNRVFLMKKVPPGKMELAMQMLRREELRPSHIEKWVREFLDERAA